MQNSTGPNNFSLDKLQNMVLNKCGSFFKRNIGIVDTQSACV